MNTFSDKHSKSSKVLFNVKKKVKQKGAARISLKAMNSQLVLKNPEAKMAKTKADIDKKVPAFKIDSSEGEKFFMSKQKGRSAVIYFYPKDNTPGCTNESKDFKKFYKQFQALDVDVYGISKDSLSSHEKFIEKLGLPFPLLSDPEEVACEIFDVMKMKNMYGRKFRGIERSTFFIDEKGYLRQEWRKVKVAGHAKAVLDFAKDYLASKA